MFRKNTCYNNNRESGVALIFALSTLALLLILLIGFLASGILEQRIAYTYGDATASRLLARGVLVRIKDQLATSAEDLIWMRNRPTEAKMLAPIVSIAHDGSLERAANDEASDNGEGGDAYQALKPLLRRYFGGEFSDMTADEIKTDWHWRNFFPAGVNVDYPQWIYYYNNPDEDMITGRAAYVIVPNFGIDPTTLAEGADHQIGVEYNELSIAPLLTANGISKLQEYNNWLTMDWVLGKEGITSNSYFADNFGAVREDFFSSYLGARDSKSATNSNASEAYREFAGLYFTTSQALGEELDYQDRSRTFFDLENVKDVSAYRAMLDTVRFQPESARNQVAANLRDYLDSDYKPSSDVDSENWLTSTPTYAGNERTPYINQIVPAIQVQADYKLITTPIRGPGGTIIRTVYTQTLTVKRTSQIFIELINIYPENFTEDGTVTIKGLEIKMEYRSSIGSFSGGSAATITAPETLNASFAGVSKNGYVVVSAVVATDSTGSRKILNNTTTVTGTVPAPELEVEIDVTSIKFDRAILSINNPGEGASTINVDYVEGLESTQVRPLVGTYSQVDPESGVVTEFGSKWTFGDVNSQKTVSAYASFEVYDPRCNLSKDEWVMDFAVRESTLSASSVPNCEERNAKADAANDDPAANKDMEPNNDPAHLVNAYIRNGAMESPWELGFIHRGVRWQTLNLKSALDPLQSSSDDVTYANDGFLWDRLKFTNDGNADKFNINYPASKGGIFALLVANLRYHKDTPAINTHKLEESSAVALSDDAREELARWIANKCYQASSGDPANDSSQAYNRYIHRGQLANVITDWALHGSHSPLKDSPVDAHIEEIIGKIAPLTRCGENFEYFTVFVVAQSIKDAQGTMYIFDGDEIVETKTNLEHGGVAESKAEDGLTTVNYDKITNTTYLVARLRRELTSCQNTDSCLQGIHHRDCRFKIVVIESYTLTDL